MLGAYILRHMPTTASGTVYMAHELNGPVQPQVWHAGNVSALPTQGKALKLAGA